MPDKRLCGRRFVCQESKAAASYLANGAQPRPCVRPAGHSGPCEDDHGHR